MKTGARNDMQGEVVEIKRDGLMGLAKVKVSGEALLSSVMTVDSIEELALKPGDKVRVVVKAIHVLLIKD
jgi:molybdopterin-binding protein